MAQGRVDWYSPGIGYGFIVPDSGDGRIFVDRTGIVGNGHKSLSNGDRVTYEVAQGRQGMEAKNVTKA